ncbi:hypothetical protein RISINGSUN_111 [Erwinia phage vB_EamM_RisingSun]|uniref:Uncharacterized protein n=1 Tax=Erwinia phage vB_EamM_RisingSun TaxID=2026080 RepID=A0A223LJ80_9CAUD|nr:hypothetical protein FDI45_gp111 [Erwinia phage vB_EamM_RisingSun]ASU03559.1 hypothetical protein RISINGSUN_111 [Erwinia phage vB_EamM_RisingSun]
MADKKKKLAPVTSNLKEDVDAAINEAAAEIVAESITQKAIAAVMDKSDKVIANTVTDVLEIVEEDETTGSVRGRLKKKYSEPKGLANGRLQLDTGSGELSVQRDKVKDVLETYPLVSIYGIELKPVGEKLSFGEVIGYDSVLGNYTRNQHRMVRYLPVGNGSEFHHFAFVLNGTTTHLFITDGSSYVVNDKNNTYYYARNKGTIAAAIIVNSKLTNVLLEGGSMTYNAIIDETTLNDSIVVTLDKEEMARNHVAGNDGMYRRGHQYFDIHGTDNQMTTVDECHLTRTDVVNCQITKVNATQTNMANTVIRNNKQTCLIDTTIGNSVIDGAFYFEARRSSLAVSINATHRVELSNVRLYGGNFHHIPYEIQVESPFGITKISWMDDTKVRMLTSKDGVVLEIPQNNVESYADRFLFIPYDQPEQPAIHLRGWQPPHVEQMITDHMRFYRNGKRLPKPDLIQQSFLTYLIDTVNSRLKVLSLLEAVKQNRHTVAPGLNRGDHDDYLPF